MPALANAQVVPSQLSGVVRDESGAPVSDLEVLVIGTVPPLRSAKRTDNEGRFKFDGMKTGPFRVVIDEPRFERTEIPVEIPRKEEPLAIALKVRALRQKITVEDRQSYAVSRDTTALRTAEPLLLTPQAVQVVPRSVLQDQNALTLTDAVRNVAGVTSDFGFNGSTQPLLILRGFQSESMTARGAMSGASSYYLDGSKVQGIPVNMANVESVSVVKGPATVLYGRAEPGGLVNVISRPFGTGPHYGIEQSATQFGATRSIFEADHPLNKSGTVLARFAGSFLHNKSNRDFVRDNLGAITGAVAWRPDTRTELSATFDYTNQAYRNDFGVPADGNRPADLPWRRQFNNSNDLSTVATKILRLRAQHEIGSKWTVSGLYVGLWGSMFENDVWPYRIDLTTGEDCFAARGELCRYYFYNRPDGGYRLNQVNVNLQGRERTGWLKHTFLTGFDYYSSNKTGTAYLQQLSSISVFNPVFTPVPPLDRTTALPLITVDRTRWASGYLQDAVDLGRGLRVVAAVRFDGTSAIYASPGTKPNEQTFVTPRVGVVWALGQRQSLYGQYQEAVSANNGRDPNTGVALAAERSKQVEAGYKFSRLDGSLNLTVAAYRLKKRNRADYTLFPLIRTIGEARSQGLEFDLLGRLTRRLATMTSYSYISGIVTRDPVFAGTTLANVPHHSGSVWLRYAATRNWSFGSGVFSQSIRQGNQRNSFQLPGYARVDAMASYQFHVSEWRSSLQLNVNNLLDRKYYTGSHQFVDDWIQLSAARTFGLTLRFER